MMTKSSHAHAITIERHPEQVRASLHGVVIANSSRTLILQEGPLPPVTYFPREDVKMSYLQRTEHTTHCPFKGDANYFSIRSGIELVENAVWTYESPISAVEGIKDFLAFDPEKVKVNVGNP